MVTPHPTAAAESHGVLLYRCLLITTENFLTTEITVGKPHPHDVKNKWSFHSFTACPREVRGTGQLSRAEPLSISLWQHVVMRQDPEHDKECLRVTLTEVSALLL